MSDLIDEPTVSPAPADTVSIPSADALPPFSAEFLSRFRPIRLLGQGGMGAVFLMQQLSLERPVAVKVVKGDVLTEAEIRRLLREARVLGSLKHPNILAIHDVGTDGTLPYMICEYVAGETVGQRLARGVPPIAEALRLGVEILDGLEAAHRQGVIHRDLKPGNIFLDEDARPVIGDFGLAKSHAIPSGTAAGRIVGTPAYMSPEQCRGHTATAASDLYSVGVLVFELLTGSRPFRGPDLFDYLTQHTQTPPPRVRSLRPELPSSLDGILFQALEKDPAARFRGAREMRDALDEVRRGLGPPREAPSAVPLPVESAPAPTPRPGLLLAKRYELVSVLGAGAMGQVWLAHDLELEREEVAVKMLPPELWRDPEARANLKQEARLSQRLAHPNVIRLMTLEASDPPFLVMERVPGGTLSDELARRKEEGRGPYTPAEALPILEGLAAGLAHAHEKGLVHRDIKPSNILLARSDNGPLVPKLADFGIAAELSSFRTRATGLVPTGTLAYMSPEQVACQKLDARSDVYSLAAVLYQMLTFAPPFVGGDIASAIKAEPVPPPEGVPAPVARVLLRALAKHRDDRPQSVGVLVAAFREATAAARPSSVRRLAVALVAVALCVLGAMLRDFRRPPPAAYENPPILVPSVQPSPSFVPRPPPTIGGLLPQSPRPIPSPRSLPPPEPPPPTSTIPTFLPSPSSPAPRPSTAAPPPPSPPPPPPDPLPQLPWDASEARFRRFTELASLPVPHGDLRSSDLSPDGRFLLVQSDTEASLRVYDVVARKLVSNHPAAEGGVPHSTQGRCIAGWPSTGAPAVLLGDDRGILLQDAASGAATTPLSRVPATAGMGWSSDHRVLVTSEQVFGGGSTPFHSRLTLYRPSGNALEPIKTLEFEEGVEAWAVDAPTHHIYLLGTHSHRLVRMDWETENRELELSSMGTYAHALALSPDARLIAVGGRSLTLIDANHPAQRWTARIFDNNLASVRFAPDGTAVAAAAYDGHVRVLSTRAKGDTLPLLADLRHNGDANVYGVHFTQDGAGIVTCGADKTVRFWGER